MCTFSLACCRFLLFLLGICLLYFAWTLMIFSSSQIRRLSALDSTWVTSTTNGLQGNAHPAWLHLYLATCKLLHLALILPANRLPQFQMYRWAFIGDDNASDGDISSSSRTMHVTPNFVPYLTRIYRLLRSKVGNRFRDCLPLLNVWFQLFICFFRWKWQKRLYQLPSPWTIWPCHLRATLRAWWISYLSFTPSSSIAHAPDQMKNI